MKAESCAASSPPKKLCLVSVARDARHTNQAKFFNQAKFAWRTTSGSFALLIAIPLWGGRPARPDGQDARNGDTYAK